LNGHNFSAHAWSIAIAEKNLVANCENR